MSVWKRRVDRRGFLVASGGVAAAFGLAGLGGPQPAFAARYAGPGIPDRIAQRPSPNSLRDGDEVNLFCLGDLDGPRWLDGRTHDGTVGLAPRTTAPFTGTRWRVVRPDPRANLFYLYCLGRLDGPRWLDGRTDGGAVGLAPNTDFPFTGTRWRMYNPQEEEDLSIVNLYCAGHAEGVRWLDGRTHAGAVGLAPDTDVPYTGTRWQLRRPGVIDDG
jgi:hypothetical protein